MKRIAVGEGVELAVQDLGDGPAVVLVPGMFLDHRIWDQQVRALTAAGFRVVCVDQRGHGASDRPLTGYDVPRLADDILEVLAALDIRAAALVGHSFAAQVAFRAAVRSPDRVERLVLVASNAVGAGRTETFPFGVPAGDLLPGLVAAEQRDLIASRRANLAGSFVAPPPGDLFDWLLPMTLQTPSWAGIACYRSLLETDQTADLARVGMPVLQLNGQDDPVLSARGAQWVNRQLRRSTLVRLPGCGHYPMLEAADAATAEIIGFLKGEV
ncbi:alpha/beta fold hydrolase [Nocardia alni]|uniref:alpha/beta fold hydrolase n=1 Tax=Nocardia alni TaxID=2815723 RepID=UPI001C2179AA|nr:alpha/beta hydrolase [Nocardia alni]